MRLIIKLLLNAIAVVILAELFSGVHLETTLTALVVAVVLSLLNLIIKPIIVILTLPISVLTLGLFLIVINTVIILLAAKLISGFNIDSFWTALIFSILLSILQSILHSLIKEDEKSSK